MSGIKDYLFEIRYIYYYYIYYYYHNFVKRKVISCFGLWNYQKTVNDLFIKKQNTPIVSGAALCAAVLGTGVRRCSH